MAEGGNGVFPILPEYKFGSIKKGKVMIAAFPDQDIFPEDIALEDEKRMLESTFQILGYERHNWSFDLKKVKKKTFFEEIERVARELEDSESFAMIVICSQQQGKLQMTSGETFDMENIYLKFDAKACEKLKCKPKLFVFHTHHFKGPPVEKNPVHHPSGIIKQPPNLLPPVTVPLEADMLVVYSFEDNMVKPEPTTMVSPNSSFIIALTEVLKNDFDEENGHKDILELMVDVSDKVLQLNGRDSPIPMVLSTLTSQYYLKKNVLAKQ